MPWGGSTNFEAVFDLILSCATMFQVSQENMIQKLFVFTDMQFDAASGSPANMWNTTFDNIFEKYKQAGYVPPKIICWNLRSSIARSVPFEANTPNVASLSGYSTELLKAVMNNEEFTPLSMLQSIIEPYVLNLGIYLPQTLQTNDIDLPNLQRAIDACQIKKAYKKN
jgi:hypothetical protein